MAFSFAGTRPQRLQPLRIGDVNFEAATVAFAGPAARSGFVDERNTATVLRFVRNCPGEWREGTSPSRSVRTVRDSLPSYGSHSSAWG